MNGTKALFCMDDQTVFLQPRGADSTPEGPRAFRFPRARQAMLAFVTVALVLFLVALCVVVLQNRRHAPEAQAFPQVSPEGNSTMEDPNNPDLDRLGEALQNLQGQVENFSTWSVELQVLSSRVDSISSQVQVLSGLLENTSAEVQMALSGQLRNTNRELQSLKQGMKEASAFSSKVQELEGHLLKTNTEIQGLKGSLKETKALAAKVQEEERGLVALQAALASQEQVQQTQGQLLQLLLQGWKSYNGALYYFSQNKKTWQNAENFCVSQGAHLASVTSEEEQEFLVRFIKDSYHWIGLTDQGTEGAWFWTDGTPFNDAQSKKFWDANQPDNWKHGEGNSEDCVHMQEKWNDIYCNALYQWVCKKSVGGTRLGPS